MMDLLSSAHVGVLEDFSSSRVLLAFDFDGTLAPIVTDPQRARLRPRTRALLAQATALYPVAVISGRSQADVARRLQGLKVASVVGNHGIESWRAADGAGAEVRRWLSLIERAVAPHRGVWVEDKTYSLAVHYRRSREKKKALAAIWTAAAMLDGVRVIPGKQVVNLLPARAPHKGVALERERERLGCDTAVYLGDDTTDEDVFTMDQPGRLLGVRVGRSNASAAAYYVRDQRSVDQLLRLLVDFRRASTRISVTA